MLVNLKDLWLLYTYISIINGKMCYCVSTYCIGFLFSFAPKQVSK